MAVWESIKRNQTSVQLINLGASLDIVDAAVKLGANRVICPGSMSEFALNGGPITGREASSPADLYAATKVAARELMTVRCRQLGVGLVWTFITSVYGPGRTDNNVLTYTIRALLNGSAPELTKLEQRWDFIYIDDLIRALELIVERAPAGGLYPIGSGEVRELSSYVLELRDQIDPGLPLSIGAVPYKSATLDCSIPNITALQQDCGFEPLVPFAEGIRRTIDFFRAELTAS